MDIDSIITRDNLFAFCAILIVIREIILQKRIRKIYIKIRKRLPLQTNEIDFTSLEPILKRAPTEQILSKIKDHLYDEKQPQPVN